MYSVQSTNTRGANDTSGTINPAALNSSGTPPNPTGTITPDDSPRGTKRSRSPNTCTDVPTGEDLGDQASSKPQKRGRPARVKPVTTRLESPRQPLAPVSQSIPPTPQSQTATLPQNTANITSTLDSPKTESPDNKAFVMDSTDPFTPKPTQPKNNAQLKAVPTIKDQKNNQPVKALPTVRDHTTDQLVVGGDEYLPRECDEAGEKKVDTNGQLNGGRQYKCRTFLVPERGNKLFMLATECARVLGYRDSYLLFNKNRSLFKIIASQVEKEDLIRQEVLPYSYRSRQIAIVTARSMFRQFGSRVIQHGRRVRDDYWESKARKQGFTEQDLAGEKRPGAAKARDAAAAAEANVNSSLAVAPRHDILYSNNSGNLITNPSPHTIQTSIISVNESPSALPMISLAPEQSELRLRDYSCIQRPRQELSGPAYYERTQPSSPSDLLSHAHQTAEYNKQINQQRCRSSEFLHHRWRQSHEQHTSNLGPRTVSSKENLSTSQTQYSPQDSSHSGQQTILSQQASHHANPSQSNTQLLSHSQNYTVPSPLRSVNSNSIQPNQLGRSPNMVMSNNGISGTPSYRYNPQSQLLSSQNQPSQNFPHFNLPSSHIQRSQHQIPPVSRHLGNGSQISSGIQFAAMSGITQGFHSQNPNNYPSDRNPQPQFISSGTPGPQNEGHSLTGQQSTNPGNNWNWNGPA